MPIPIVVVWIVVGVVTLLVGTTITVKWDDIVISLKGKRLAVLGARGVGKTHLIKFMTSGSIPAEYKQTLAPEKASARRFQLKELDLKVKDTLDVSGDKAAYAAWRELHDQSDVVFYLLRADRLIAKDKNTETRVQEDLEHIEKWLDAKSPRPRFFIIGTHCDFDHDFLATSANNFGDYVDKFRRLPIVRQLVALGGGSPQVQVVLGSMKTDRDTEALVYQIFMQVKS